LRRLKKGGWITPLSTRILKPSLHESFEEKYTGSLEDIPVSPSVAQESEKERKTQDTCGPISESMSGQLDLFGAFSKMSEVTPRWGYGESCPIWKKMVTERSGDCSARRKQAHLTNASDASSLPTVAARDHKGCYKTLVRKDGKPRGDLLPDAVNIAEQNWPTPRAGNPGSRKPGTGGKILAEEAKKNWPTASVAGCVEGGVAKNVEMTQSGFKATRENGTSYGAKLRDAVIHHENNNGLPAQEKSSTSGKNHGSPKLNPNWVEQLMGLPVGWTQLPTAWTDSASSEMALSPKPQK